MSRTSMVSYNFGFMSVMEEQTNQNETLNQHGILLNLIKKSKRQIETERETERERDQKWNEMWQLKNAKINFDTEKQTINFGHYVPWSVCHESVTTKTTMATNTTKPYLTEFNIFI